MNKNTTTKHTPGPWITLERYTNRQAVPIGRARGSMAHDIFAEAHGHNCEANARLISQAPAMLEALKHLTAEMGREFEELPAGVQCWFQTALSVIAKAEGKE